MGKSKSQGHGFLSRLWAWILFCICAVVVVSLVIFGLNDNWRHENQQDRNAEMHVVNTAQNIYNKESGPLENYVRNRTNGDLNHQSQMTPIQKLHRTLSSHMPTQVSNVSLDDNGNGSMKYNGRQYAFKLNNLAFAPQNSQFYTKNQTAIKSSIAQATQGGNFSVTKASNGTINLYQNHHLVANKFLAQGIAYMPNTSQHHASYAQETMLTTEKRAKLTKKGMWSTPNIMSNKNGKQSYNTSAEKNHHVTTIQKNNNNNGGATLTQKIAQWFGKY